ncbi:hypothetical protein EDB19DRAFT_243987 [Suillus lakei]|nr:hypothetical protein EDB19DRAFT_243987 [Suillus lakei]
MADSATPTQTNQPHVALITGAAQGIGRAIALRPTEDGLDIAIADLKSQRTNLDGIADEVRAKGRRCLVLECDISQEEEVQRMVQAMDQEFDALDIMVANAGRGDQCAWKYWSIDFFYRYFGPRNWEARSRDTCNDTLCVVMHNHISGAQIHLCLTCQFIICNKMVVFHPRCTSYIMDVDTSPAHDWCLLTCGADAYTGDPALAYR